MQVSDTQLQSNDCGISAVKTVFNIYQKPIARTYIEQNIPLEEKGASLSDIKTFFCGNGFDANYKLLDVNSVQGDFNVVKNLFPFILPVKHNEGLHYLVINSLKKGKLKVYDPAKGSQYYLSLSELKQKSYFSKSSWELAEIEDKLSIICSDDLMKYQISLEDALLLQKNDIAELFNKLSYFSYLKNNFGFKNKEAEKEFILDLIKNQEISKLPRHFKTLKYKEGKVKIKAPLILTLKPKVEADKQEYPTEENENLYKKLYSQLGTNKRLWLIYIFAALFSASTTQFSVFINQILIDHVLPSFNIGTLILFAIGLSVYKLFDVVTSSYKKFVGIHLGNVLDRFFLNRFDTKINEFSLSYIQSYKKGDLIERVSDALKLKRFFIRFFTNVLIDIFVSVYSLAILFYINWKLTLLVAGVMILFYLWFKFITPYLKQNERLRYIRKADFLSKMIEKIEGIQVIKSFRIEQNYSNKINRSASEYLNIQLKNGYISLINNIVVSLIIIIFSILIIVVLSKSAIETQSITLGQIITFIALSGKIFSSLKNILNENLTLQENEVILKRFFDFNEDKNTNSSNKGISNFRIESFQVKNLSFGYQNNDNVLKNINLTFKAKDKIKIEGQNGSGKSTLSKVLTALYELNNGEIIINQNDSKFYNSNTLRNKILLSTNEDLLFNDTIEGNICLGKDISASKILALAKKIGFYDFIASKDEGLDFIIHENGKNLSTGQRKKILLLRAFFSTSEIIILDEVLSGLDKESRHKVENYINNDPRTYIIISHEPISDISFSQKYKIDNGELCSI